MLKKYLAILQNQTLLIYAGLLCSSAIFYYFWRVFCNSNGAEGVPHLLAITARCLVYPGGTFAWFFLTQCIRLGRLFS